MGNCSCIYVGDFENPEFYRKRTHKAVKEHVCCECSRAIKRGEQYEYVSALWDNYFSTYKTCSTCLSIRHVFFCEGWLFEGLLSDLSEHLGEVDGEVEEDCLLDLIPEARDMVCGMIEDIWEE